MSKIQLLWSTQKTNKDTEWPSHLYTTIRGAGSSKLVGVPLSRSPFICITVDFDPLTGKRWSPSGIFTQKPHGFSERFTKCRIHSGSRSQPKDGKTVSLYKRTDQKPHPECLGPLKVPSSTLAPCFCPSCDGWVVCIVVVAKLCVFSPHSRSSFLSRHFPSTNSSFKALFVYFLYTPTATGPLFRGKKGTKLSFSNGSTCVAYCSFTVATFYIKAFSEALQFIHISSHWRNRLAVKSDLSVFINTSRNFCRFLGKWGIFPILTTRLPFHFCHF